MRAQAAAERSWRELRDERLEIPLEIPLVIQNPDCFMPAVFRSKAITFYVVVKVIALFGFNDFDRLENGLYSSSSAFAHGQHEKPWPRIIRPASG